MKIIVSHLNGNANVKAALHGFLEENLLAEFHVSLAVFPGTLLDSLGSIKAFSEVRRRQFDKVLKPFTHSWPLFETGRLLSEKAGLSGFIRHENGIFCVDKVARNIDKKVASRVKYSARHGVSAIYGYEDYAVNAFKEGKRLGLQCFYDLPIGYWRTAHRILEAEKERWPAWSSTLRGLQDSPAKLERKDKELRMADKIFVASSFTAATLKDFPGTLAPVEVIPYGFPPVEKERKTYEGFSHGRPLKLLFAGSLSQRKGIANLFTAVQKFGNHIQLTVVGKKTTDACPALDRELAKHHWIPSLSHQEMLTLMRQQDILVFPSLFEGFGLVITEAMSQGTPVITTENTIGPDMIEHGKNGWLVKAGSTEALEAAIEELLRRPNLIAVAGKEAMETASKRPWEVYGRELAKAVANNLQ